MTYIVKVQDYEGSNKFQLNGLRQKIVVANASDTIVFDQSDSSNAGHPLVIALYADGHHNAEGNEYTVGVTKTGTPGSSGAKTTFVLNDQTLNGTYYYYCQNHAGMGGMIHFGADTDINGNIVGYPIIDEGAIAYDAQDNNENLTSNIIKTVEKWDDVGTDGWQDQGYDYSSHTNPWKIQGTDTRESATYRVSYNVTDSGGLSAPTRTKIFNIGGPQENGSLTFKYEDAQLGEVVGYAVFKIDEPGDNFNVDVFSSKVWQNINTSNWGIQYDGMMWWPNSNMIPPNEWMILPYFVFRNSFYPDGFLRGMLKYEGANLNDVLNRESPGAVFLNGYGWNTPWSSGKSLTNTPFLGSYTQGQTMMGNADWVYNNHLSGYVSASIIGNSSVHKYKLRHINPDNLSWTTTAPPITDYTPYKSSYERNILLNNRHYVVYEWYRFE